MNKFKDRLLAFFKGERATSAAMTAVIIALVIVVNVIVYAFGVILYQPDLSDDLTISGATDALFTEERTLGKKVTVTFCQSYEDIQKSSSSIPRWVLSTAEQLADRYPDLIEIRFVNIITKQVVSRNDSSNIGFIDLTKYITKDSSGNDMPIYKSSVIFECGKNFKVLTDNYSTAGYADFFTLDSSGNAIAYNGEEVMASMISWVLDGKKKTAYFTTFHGEVADIGFRNMLICAGYDVATINLREKDIPEDAEIVVISNPKNDFERAAAGTDVKVKAEIGRLEAFMKRGGNLFVAIDPYAGKLPVLESFLAKYGITVSSTERDGKFYRNIIRDTDNAITADFFTMVADFADTEYGNAMESTIRRYTDAGVILSNCASLKLSGRAQALLVSSPVSTTHAGKYEVDRSGNYCMSAVSTALDDSGKEAGRIMVVPSIYLTATDILISGGYANRDFLYSLVDDIYGGENIPYGCNTVFYSNDTLENLTMKSARIYTAIIFAIPVVAAVCGAVVVIRRKNR